MFSGQTGAEEAQYKEAGEGHGWHSADGHQVLNANLRMNVKQYFVSGSEISSTLLPLVVVVVQNSSQRSHRSLGFPCRLLWERNYDYSKLIESKGGQEICEACCEAKSG